MKNNATAWYSTLKCMFHIRMSGMRLAPTKRCKMFIKQKRWTLCSDDASVATMAAEKAILCVLFEELSEPDEIGINTCLVLQNTLDATVTALAVQNKRDHPKQVKGFVETVVPYCDPTFASYFRMKRQTFQVKDNPLLTYETLCYDLYDLIICIVSIRLINIANHCCCAVIL